MTAAGEYVFVFKTATTTVDQRHVPSLWVVGKAWVERLAAAGVRVDLAQTGVAFRDVSAVAEADVTLSDCLAGGLVAAAGARDFPLLPAGTSSTSYVVRRPSGGAFRTFTVSIDADGRAVSSE